VERRPSSWWSWTGRICAIERASWLNLVRVLLLLWVGSDDNRVRAWCREHLIWTIQDDAPYAGMTRTYLDEKCPKLASPAVPPPNVGGTRKIESNHGVCGGAQRTAERSGMSLTQRNHLKPHYHIAEVRHLNKACEMAYNKRTLPIVCTRRGGLWNAHTFSPRPTCAGFKEEGHPVC
jgi:hypothetical protein